MHPVEVAFLVWLGAWFPVAVLFARTWPDRNRCPNSCRHVTQHGMYRVFHSEACVDGGGEPRMISPAGACGLALAWPFLLPYKAVEWSATAHLPRRKPKLLSDRELAALERECDIYNKEGFGR